MNIIASLGLNPEYRDAGDDTSLSSKIDKAIEKQGHREGGLGGAK